MSRTSAFVPVNIPIIGGMLLSAPTMFNTILWQWVNQTYNAGLNYGNRNASSTISINQLAQSYCFAVTVSISAAMALRKLFSRFTQGKTGLLAACLNSTVSLGAVALSSSLNVYVVRQGEIKQGITVTDSVTG